MSRIDHTLKALENKLTPGETQGLKTGSTKEFFQSILAVYEEKAAKYLRAERKIDGKKVQPIQKVEFAYATLLKQSAVSFLPSLRTMISAKDPDLLPSLGLPNAAQSEQTEELAVIGVRVFKYFMGRLRLFNDLGAENLVALWKDVAEGHEVEGFPKMLLDSLIIQQLFTQSIQDQCKNFPSKDVEALKPSFAFNVMQKPLAVGAVFGVLKSLGHVLGQMNVSAPLSDKYFSYLKNSKECEQFIELMTKAYMKTNSVEFHSGSIQKANEVYQHYSQALIPDIPFLGIRVVANPKEDEMKLAALEKQKREIDQSFERTQSLIDDQKRQAIRNAHEQIDERLDEIRNRSNWVIGFNTGFQTDKY